MRACEWNFTPLIDGNHILRLKCSFVLILYKIPMSYTVYFFFQWSSTDRSYEEPDESRNYRSKKTKGSFNPSLTSGDFCHLLISCINTLNPHQTRQIVGPDLDPNCYALWWYSWKSILKVLQMKYADDKKAWKFTQHAKSYFTLLYWDPGWSGSLPKKKLKKIFFLGDSFLFCQHSNTSCGENIIFLLPFHGNSMCYG